MEEKAKRYDEIDKVIKKTSKEAKELQKQAIEEETSEFGGGYPISMITSCNAYTEIKEIVKKE